MRKETNSNDNSQMTVIPDDGIAIKQNIPKEEKRSVTLSIKEAREEMEAFRQPQCWVDTKDLTQDAIIIWNKLKTSQMIPFSYPVNYGEKRGTIQTATIDGLKFVLRSGYTVKIPVEIYGLFQNKLDAESGVGRELRVENQGEDVRIALTR